MLNTFLPRALMVANLLPTTRAWGGGVQRATEYWGDSGTCAMSQGRNCIYRKKIEPPLHFGLNSSDTSQYKLVIQPKMARAAQAD